MQDEALAARALERQRLAIVRAENADRRAVEAHAEARIADSLDLEQRHEREALVHERAAQLHRDAAVIQGRHAAAHC